MHTACPSFPCPLLSLYGIIVLKLALRIAQPLRPRPRRHRSSTNAQLRISHGTTGRERARWSHSSQLHLTRHGRPNGAGLHMQALKPPAATGWGLRAIITPLAPYQREPARAANQCRAQKSSLSAADGHLVASRPHAGTCSCSFRLACLLRAFCSLTGWPGCAGTVQLRRGLQAAGTQAADKFPELTGSMPSFAHHQSSHTASL